MTRFGNLSPSLYTYSDLDFTIPITLEYSFDCYRPEKHSGTYTRCGNQLGAICYPLGEESRTPGYFSTE